MDRRGVAIEVARLPLARVAADEAIEVVIALTDRPVLERSLRARLPGRHIVVLAEPRGRITILLQNRRAMRGLWPRDEIVAGIPGRRFRHRAEADAVMIAAGEQRGPGRRAERRIVHLRVAEARLRQLVQGWRRHEAAERGVRAEARVVDQDKKHVRRAFGRHDGRRPAGLAVDEVRRDEALERRRRRRQHLRVRGTGRLSLTAPSPPCGSRRRRAPRPARPSRTTETVPVDSS